MILRISRGRFEPTHGDTVRQMLAESEAVLRPAMSQLNGFQGYYTGVDANDGSMIAVSLWDSVEHASQLGRLPEMMQLRTLFEAANIAFDPITTYDILWQL